MNEWMNEIENDYVNSVFSDTLFGCDEFIMGFFDWQVKGSFHRKLRNAYFASK